MDHAVYTSSQDIVGKFRIFDKVQEKTTRENVADYLSVYSTVPLTKDEMMDNIVLNAMKYEDIAKHFKVKRQGADRNDIFWQFGKIHGLENIAFADP